MKYIFVIAFIAGFTLTGCKGGKSDEAEKKISDSLAARSRDSDMKAADAMLKKNRDSAAKADTTKK